MDESAAGGVLQEHDSDVGMLQRGRGLVARHPDAYGLTDADVLDCVCWDPRWDSQAESRGASYAELIDRLGCGLDVLRDHLFSPQDIRRTDHPQPEDYWRSELTVNTLGELARRGRTDARDLLRAYAVTGANWDIALDELADLADPETLGGDLQAQVLERLDDELLAWVVDPRNGPWRAWATTSPRVARALQAQRARWAEHQAAQPTLDVAAATTLELRAAVGRRNPNSRRAAIELGRRGDAWLLTCAEELFTPPRPTYAPPGLFQGLKSLPVDVFAPWARHWAGQDANSSWPVSLLAEHPAQEDTALMLDALRAALVDRNWGAAVSPVEALGRLRAQAATPLLAQAWAQTAYAYLRPRVLRAQLSIDPAAATDWLAEGPWDCDELVRELSVTAAG